MREIDAGLDVEAVLDFIEDYGAGVWLLSVGGIIANHPSDLASQTVNPALAQRPSGDLVGDATAAAAARGVRVLGRMDFSKVDRRRAEEHPEWCFVDADGANQVYNDYVSVCPSGDYYQHEVFEIVAEVLQRYPLSGFFFNWMSFNEYDYSRRYWGVCHCGSCQRGFAEHAPGTPLPRGKGDPGYPTWRRWSAGVLDDLTARMRAHVQRLNPEAALILGDRADITFHEANNAVGRPMWHHATAEAVSAARSSRADRPVLVNSVGFVDMPYRWAGEDPEHFAQYLLQAIAHGAQPSTYVMGTPADSPFGALATGREITRFHRDHADLYTGLHSVARVALVRGADPDDPDFERRTDEFQGCYLGLGEAHVPFDVVRLDRLAEVAADRYALLVLPDLGPLPAAAVAALRAAMAAGASVVATGDSGWEQDTCQLVDQPLARRVARFTGEESLRSLHLRLDGTFPGDLAPVLGAFEVLRPTAAATTAWPSLGRARYGPPEACYGHRDTAHPGWLSGDVGAGRLALMPWRPGLVYRRLGLGRVRDAWVEQVLALTTEPLRMVTTLPLQVQVVPARFDTGIAVHLLNHSGDAAQRSLPPVTVAPARLCVPVGPGSQELRVRCRVAGVEPSWRRVGDDLKIELPAIDRFEVLTVENV
nr:beta-galactosidase [Auraticoccus cholistanensis]